MTEDKEHSRQERASRPRRRGWGGLNWDALPVRRTLKLVERLTGRIPGEREQTDAVEEGRLRGLKRKTQAEQRRRAWRILRRRGPQDK